MKTLYIFKSGFPAFFLPLAPEVAQDELERHGMIAGGGSMLAVVTLQVLLTFAVVAWLVRSFQQRKKDTEFLRMSCVSKKVFHQGRWMSVESYLADQHNIVVSHGMTPEESDAWLRESREWAEAEIANENEIEAETTGRLQPVLK
jgi:hypothetical protein